MIISRTPLRVSLFGGGTDMPEFYQKTTGAVLSFAIDKYVYISVNPKFDGKYRISYSRTENVDSIGEIEHDLVRETLKYMNVQGVEVTSISDIPGGSGLGSSSAFIVGLLRVLQERYVSAGDIARLAYRIERELCKHLVGRQDHLASAYGGLCHHLFYKNGQVVTEQLLGNENGLIELEQNLLLLWLDVTRDADDVLKEQGENFNADKEVFKSGVRLRDLALSVKDRLLQGDYGAVGDALDESWRLKKSFATGVSNHWIDGLYDAGLRAGAKGGKVCGAGGGGFLLFYVEPQMRQLVLDAVPLREIPFKIVPQGSEVVYHA